MIDGDTTTVWETKDFDKGGSLYRGSYRVKPLWAGCWAAQRVDLDDDMAVCKTLEEAQAVCQADAEKSGGWERYTYP